MLERPEEIVVTESATCAMVPEESKTKKLDDVEYKNSMVAHIIDEYVHSKRDREILKARIIDGEFLDPLSERYNLTPRQVGNIITKYEAVIFKHLA